MHDQWEQPRGGIDCDRLAARIRAECLRKGWSPAKLADRAGLSRTSIYKLVGGKTAHPRNSTLTKIANELELTAEVLCEPNPRKRPTACSLAVATSPAEESAQFDRRTNPLVADVAAETPELFRGWTRGEWDELYSSVGTGGPLTREGVVEAATELNRNRETVRQLQIVLETHLGDAAAVIIKTMYELVRIDADEYPQTD